MLDITLSRAIARSDRIELHRVSSRWPGQVKGAIDATIPRIGLEMKRSVEAIIAFLGLIVTASVPAAAAGVEYPQLIRTRYEAVDQRIGGNFVIFSEREKIFYGLDPKLYPGARYVEVTQVTPTVGSTTLTFVEITTVASATSDYIHLTGNVRFRISGMVLKSSNFPPGAAMSP